MTLFHMTSSLMTGHIQIDTEHEHLLVLLNQFDSLLKADDAEGCAVIITQLTEALESHLHNEERIMKDHGYPDLVEHKAKHATTKNSYLELIEDCRQNGYGDNFSDKLIAIFAEDLITADLDFKVYLGKMAYKG